MTGLWDVVGDERARGVREQTACAESVLIVESHRPFGEAMALSLRSHGYDVVGVTSSGREALRLAREGTPDVVLLGTEAPDMDAFAVGEQLLSVTPDLAVVAMSAGFDSGLAKQALRVGFRGFLSRDVTPEELVQAIEVVARGETVISAGGAPPAVTRPEMGGDNTGAERLVEELTSREREVLRLLVQGASNSEIADHMHISPHTVRRHVQNLLPKLGVRSRVQAATYAAEHGLLERLTDEAYGSGQQEGRTT